MLARGKVAAVAVKLRRRSHLSINSNSFAYCVWIYHFYLSSGYVIWVICVMWLWIYMAHIDASYCVLIVYWLCTDCVLIVYWLYNSGHWDIQNMTSLGSCLEPAAAEAAATSKSTCWSMRAYQVQLMVLLFCLLKAGLVRDGSQCMVMDA